LLQPLLDAFKLLSKQSFSPLRSNKLVYNISPQNSLSLSLFVWCTMPLVYRLFRLGYSFLMFYCLSSVIVFLVLLSGWSSNSKYSLIGRLRSIAQSVSYETVIRTIVVILCVFLGFYNISSFNRLSSWLFIYFVFLWIICILAETHRAPFDFRESESELVSGFNTEYSGAYFAFLFLSEYAMLLYSCFLIVYVFLGGFIGGSFLVCVLLSLFVRFIFIWVRITFCRFRYDLLMMFAWKVILPLVLNILVFYLVLGFF